MWVTWHLIFGSNLDLKFGIWPENKPVTRK